MTAASEAPLSAADRAKLFMDELEARQLPATIDAEQTALNSIMQDLGVTPAMVRYIKTEAANHLFWIAHIRVQPLLEFTEYKKHHKWTADVEALRIRTCFETLCYDCQNKTLGSDRLSVRRIVTEVMGALDGTNAEKKVAAADRPRKTRSDKGKSHVLVQARRPQPSAEPSTAPASTTPTTAAASASPVSAAASASPVSAAGSSPSPSNPHAEHVSAIFEMLR
jgi:hypothetical protein